MPDPSYEFRIQIADKFYGMDTLMSAHIQQPLFDKFDVGLACCAQLDIKYRVGMMPEPPSGAKVLPEYREQGTTKWKCFGTFYIDMRTTHGDVKSLICYDSMMRADAPYPENVIPYENWPIGMSNAASSIAEQMGVKIDSRTQLNNSYLVDYPDGVPMRSTLQYIAAAHGGNWIMTANNEMLLVPLFSSMPDETSYLIDEAGYAILIGGDHILV